VQELLQPVDQMRGDLGVARRGRQSGVTEQHLDDADVDAGFEQVRREAVSIMPSSALAP
jgi:hypothetical protein